MSIFRELKRRNVFRVGAAYVVSAWLLIEIGNTLEETLNLPEWSDTLLAFFLIIGFPIVLFFSWAYEITPEGIKREEDIEADDASRAVTAGKLNRALLLLMAMALVYFAVDKFVFTGAPQPVAGAQQSAVEPFDAAVTVTGETSNEAVSIPDKSIAVLPFINMSSDPEQEYFSDGLTEELLNLLAGIDDLKVAARTSSFYYKDKIGEVPMKEMARQLEVAHILEGSVRKGGDKIRITAQLIKADDGFHLWSETYDRTLDDVFAIQDEIAAAVVGQLKVTLLGEAPHSRVIDPESYQLALRGRFLYNRRDEGDLDRAFELFERAIEIDPDNAIAWVGLAPLYIYLFDPPRPEDALAAAEKALELDPDNAEAYARKAMGLSFSGGPEEEYAAAWSRAMELGQDNQLILSMRAGQLAVKGEIEQALEYQRRALAADPLHLININNMANYLLHFGRWREAEPYVGKLIELSPDSDSLPLLQANSALQRGRPAEALALLEPVTAVELRASSDNSLLWLKILANHDLGNHEEAERLLAEYITSEQERLGHYPFWPAVNTAAIHAYMGEADQAFEGIDRALEHVPEPALQPFLNWRFFDLHDDPRWQRVEDLYPDFQGWDQLRR